MQDEIIFVVEKSPEGGYEACAVGHSIYTYADTLGELQVMAEGAVRCHFEEGEQPSCCLAGESIAFV
ncbi:MAG: 2-oxoisovalerate dehydrogenase [Caldilineaceae bacterium]|nr:2-oxoisovalerate dehydrogenase [Caldilineaceae bacterium]